MTSSGQYIFVACNSSSAVYVVESETLSVVDSIRCDSYPVGLALSPDGKKMVVTSQARNYKGGNAVNIFAIEWFGDEEFNEQTAEPDEQILESDEPTDEPHQSPSIKKSYITYIIICLGVICAVIIIVLLTHRRSSRSSKK